MGVSNKWGKGHKRKGLCVGSQKFLGGQTRGREPLEKPLLWGTQYPGGGATQKRELRGGHMALHTVF